MVAIWIGCAPPGPLPPMTAGELVAAMSSQQTYSSLKAGGSVTLDDGQIERNALMTIQARVPTHLRADIIGLFGVSLASFALVGDEGTAWYPRDGVAVYFSGGVLPLIEDMSVRAEHLFAAISPPKPDLLGFRTTCQVWARRYLLRTETAEGMREWWISPDPMRVVEEAAFDSLGAPLWHRRFRRENGITVPFEIDIFAGSSSSRIVLNSITLGPTIGDGAFVIQVPTDAKIVRTR